MKPEILNARWDRDERLDLIEQAKKAQDELDAESQAAAGITFSQAAVLALVESAGGIATVSSLGQCLERAVHTQTSMVNSLEKHRLVQRYRQKREDRRVIRIQITASGSEKLKLLRATKLPLPQRP